MFFRQYYLGCLSHASYLIGDTTTGRAVVVDPQRDVAEYLTDAEAHGLSITQVLETHFHADFLSGHLELAAQTGATIGYGRAAAGRAEFPIETYADGDRILLGEVELEILETPGHTPESISIVVYPNGGGSAPYGVLTGDTLFIGDVGRPDLLASVGVTAEELAKQLFSSLHAKLLTLPDDTKVFPAHGAGSACGKNLSTETVSTIGEQRRTNYALAPMSEAEFVEAVTQGQSVAPLYFSFAANRNRQQRELLAEDISVAEPHDEPGPCPPARRRGRDRCSRRHVVRRWSPAWVGQRRARRSFRRVRRGGHGTQDTDRARDAARPRGGSEEFAWPASDSTASSARSRILSTPSSSIPNSSNRCRDCPPKRLPSASARSPIWSSSMSATPVRWRSAPSPAPRRSVSPSCSPNSTASTGPRRQ